MSGKSNRSIANDLAHQLSLSPEVAIWLVNGIASALDEKDQEHATRKMERDEAMLRHSTATDTGSRIAVERDQALNRLIAAERQRDKWFERFEEEAERANRMSADNGALFTLLDARGFKFTGVPTERVRQILDKVQLLSYAVSNFLDSSDSDVAYVGLQQAWVEFHGE